MLGIWVLITYPPNRQVYSLIFRFDRICSVFPGDNYPKNDKHYTYH